MKKVLLLGDSIRQNYEYVVKENLADQADVIFTNDNNRFSVFMLRYLGEWIDALTESKPETIDIIHFNCGLWDVVRLSNEDTTLVSLPEYKRYLERIYNRLRFLCPNSIILAAETTSVIEPGMDVSRGIGIRKNEDIIRFNDCLRDFCQRKNIPRPGALYDLTMSAPADYRSDNVHFDTEKGRRMLGNYVAEYIRRYL